jgi:hypothetical protein
MEMNYIRLKSLDDSPQYRKIRKRNSLPSNRDEGTYTINFYAIHLTHAIEMTLIKTDYSYLMARRIVCQIFADILYTSYIWVIIL